jgi:hypothetical protein
LVKADENVRLSIWNLKKKKSAKFDLIIFQEVK